MSNYQFNLPDIGEGLGEGEIVRWLIEPGGAVTADQAMVEVETDKALVEIPAPVTGTLKTMGGIVGDVIAVGTLLAVIETDSEATPAGRPEPTAELVKTTPSPAAASPQSGRVLAAPATRKYAVELGLDLTAIQGSGPHGRITREDVEQAAGGGSASPEAPAPNTVTATPPKEIQPATPRAAPSGRVDEVVTLRGLRKTIAENMTASLQVPTIIDWHHCDATELIAARDSLKEEFATQGVKLTYLPFFIKACVLALQKVPSMNAVLDMDKGEIIYRKHFNIGIATATESGLIVPVIHDADLKSIFDLAIEINELAELSRSRKVPRDRLTEGTFTITNFGSYGSRMGTPIIRPPEVAIGGFGSIHDEVIPIKGEPTVRPILPVCAATDHRLNDGEHLWTFIRTVTDLLEKPTRILGYV
jgi:pyruvate dehydrogenase E2 component (dihydrolipoamide acetyltransferase)